MPPTVISDARGPPSRTVPHTNIPRRITEIQFGTFSPHDIRRLSHVHVFSYEEYVPGKPVPFGILDERMGVCNKRSTCKTCGLQLDDCTGHFGHIELGLPVFHNGFLKATLAILRCICKSCSRVLISGPERDKFLARMRNKKTSSARRAVIQANLVAMCQKVIECPHCGFVNGRVKKEKGSKCPKLLHERFGDGKKAHSLQTIERSKLEGDMEEALNANDRALKPYINRVCDDLSPLAVRELLSHIPGEDLELLDMHRHTPASNLVVSTLLVPPVCIRPSIDAASAGGAAGSFKDDDLTSNLLSTLVDSEALTNQLAKGETPGRIWSMWETLQCDHAFHLDADMPGFPNAGGRSRRSLVQRLKGKDGRFRRHLSGKRVDFSGRTVISPDPNLRITEVAVPTDIAMILTYPERVFEHNRTRLSKAIVNGTTKHPGAVYVRLRNGDRKGLAVMSERDREQIANNLQCGDIVDRHMINGDCVIFNRQPSLHRISMMCHRARVLPYRTLRFNECCCAPYNADFDGDEMNIHLPQTEEARAECSLLMGTARNVISARHGEPIIAATQDFLTGGYLLTRKNVFLDRAQFGMALSHMHEEGVVFDLPPPTILKPRELWTGKQLISLLVRPSPRVPVLLNFEAKSKNYTGKAGNDIRHMCPKDGWVCFRNSELITGTLDKKLLGGGGKDGLFYQLFLAAGQAYSARCMWRIARLTSRWLMNHGFSIGIDDVTPSKLLVEKKNEIIEKGYEDCRKLIHKFNTGELVAAPGCTREQTVESELNGGLSKVREDCGTLCMRVLHWSNSPFIMSCCGSKGSPLNISQMAAVLGQQTVSGKRIGNGFIHRSLPHFHRYSREPRDRGFVAASFYTGLAPYEFFFHTMGGREGLVDTAVKTAETGYMQRRLVKSMEDLCVQYDYKVTDSQGVVVQRLYGDDGIDPLYTETANFRPVNFDILWNNLQQKGDLRGQPLSDKTAGLQPDDIPKYVSEILSIPKVREQFSLKFISELEAFWKGKAEELRGIQKMVSLSHGGKEGVAENNPSDPLAKARQWYKQKLRAKMSEKLQRVCDDMLFVSKALIDQFIEECLYKHQRYKCEPGTACGPIGAQSIGEPGTQMTLKTFHFAGVASMSITQGVPRIKEIINAAKTIKTPIITARLTNETDVRAAKIVKARAERTTLGEICEHIDEVYTPHNCYLSVRIDLDAVFDLQLDIDVFHIREAILEYAAGTTRKRAAALPLKDKHIPKEEVTANTINIYPYEATKEKLLHCLHRIKKVLPDVVVAGIPTVRRAVLNQDPKTGKCSLLIEGSDLLQVASIPGIDPVRTVCNHIFTVEAVLGIEAARMTIIREIREILGNYGLAVDVRHVMQLADVMTFKGQVLGITRFGMMKMRDSVMMLASFEKTTDVLFDAAVHHRKDAKMGVSEQIIMGAPIKVGTGLFSLLNRVSKVRPPERKVPIFARSSKIQLDVVGSPRRVAAET